MHVDFHQDDQLSPDEIKLLVSANQLTPDVVALINRLAQLETHSASVLPLSIDDRVEMVNLNDIVSIEVFGSDLTIATLSHDYSFHGQLKRILAKINDDRFIQIARGTAINIDHLNSLEAGFSGNMTAFLDHEIKLNVSRKYLPELKARLRM
ncbi:LytTR family DNA-binding domain-containing protein [Lactobacillus sp. Sy-1]|uniref:LytTR family DNA-binding domain-containing protein n=1 Tax=Lactobacillus sp. Sy-1 TaxID=2109645 RepID=UPI001C5640EF|nr:LytTR family DNA-binding domain-containing protein [Lactobacillus sp. Sy-1]MBW1605090.1 LytTR family transcriptional regulator [Lactobacillus sp. Sy-1]